MVAEPWRKPWLAALLSPLGWLWRGGAGINRALWRTGLRARHRFPVPVISVGNLTVGGTGKTPAVSRVIEALPEELRPALVLARDYGEVFALDGWTGNDEGHLLRRRHPEAHFAQAADRVAAAEPFFAAGEPPRCVILDDGAQHRRIRRDLEIQLFDLDQLRSPRRALPAGPWREGLGAARAADLVLLTGTARGEEEERGTEAARGLLRRAGVEAPILRARHRPRDLADLAGTTTDEASALDGATVGLVIGIARPERVRQTLEALGARVLWMEASPDHQAFVGDIPSRLAARRAADPVDRLVTTEKDVPKLRAAFGAAALPDLAVLRVDLEIEDAATPSTLESLLGSLHE